MEKVITKFERVMLIDDNEIDLYITSRIVTKHLFGKTLLQYSEAQDALKYLTDNQENLEALPQVIFVDIHMPVMSGFQFMEAYGKLPAALKNYCKAYILSSTFDLGDISKANNDVNVINFQEKPITPEFLSKIIAN